MIYDPDIERIWSDLSVNAEERHEGLRNYEDFILGLINAGREAERVHNGTNRN